MANSVTPSHVFGTKAVTSAGVAEALVSVPRPVIEVMLIAHDDNSGRVYYGGSDVNSSTQRGLLAGESVTFGVPDGEPFDLAQTFIDVSVSGEDVDFIAVRPRKGMGRA